jgi:hypothetical protein
VHALGFMIRILALRSAHVFVDLFVHALGFVIRILAL